MEQLVLAIFPGSGGDAAVLLVHAQLLQSCPTLCSSMDCSTPGSFVHGIFQARVLEWGAIALSEHSLLSGSKFSLYSHRCARVLICVRLCNSMDCSPPGSSVHGISQARTLEWFAMLSSRGSSQPRDQTCVSYVSCIGRWVLYHKCHLGSPIAWLLPCIRSLHYTNWRPPMPDRSLQIAVP